MNNKELCFKIKDKELILDHILVEYNNIPVFFVCKDNENQYYIVLYPDVNNNIYIITKTKKEYLIKLLTNKITMREIILSSSEFIEIQADEENVYNDNVIFKNIELVDLSYLPKNESYYKMITKADKNYLNELQNKKEK